MDKGPIVFRIPLKIRFKQNANDEGYEAHTYQAWALVVFSKRSRLGIVSLRGACCYMKVLAPFSKMKEVTIDIQLNN